MLPPMATLNVRVTPRARTQDARVDATGTLLVRVRAPALDGRANVAALTAVAEALGVPVTTLRLLRGERGRRKVLEVGGLAPEELSGRLGRLPRA